MKLKYIILATAAITALSCVKEKTDNTNPQAGERVTIKVSTSDEMAGKVSLTEASDKKAMNLAWENTDKLSINGKEFSVTRIISAHEAEFSGDNPGDGPYTIIYPGNLTSADAFNARSYTEQTQSGNSSTTHLAYNAMLSGVSEYQEPKFDAAWAAAKGGSLVQNGAIQLRLQLPNNVTVANSVMLVASRAVFPTTNAGGTLAKTQKLTLNSVALPSNRILEAYMMFSAAGVVWQDDDKLTVVVETPDAVYYRVLPDMTAQTWAGGGQYTIQCKVNTENSFVINDADDLEEFRDGVNSGDFLWQTCHVSLGADIDCSGIASWTPIGNGTFNTTDYSVTGNSFRGTFDGGNYALLDLQINGTPAASAPYGFFGILEGATVKNLSFGAASADTGFFKVTPSGVMAAGILAGVSISSTIENITNYSPMSILENTSSDAAYFGMVGYLLGKPEGRTHLDNVDNYGEINAHTGANTTNGGAGFQVGGVAGFSHTTNASIKNLLENCDNYGDLTTSTGRVAGILAAANSRTEFDTCINRGNITNSCANSRVGGVAVIMGTGSSMTDCSNYGQVVTTTSDGQAGGLVCLINNDNITVSGGGNHGLVVSDASYRGTLIANFNAFNSVDNVIAGGAIANYNGGDFQYSPVLTVTNYMDYIGVIKSGYDSKVTNIVFEAWDGYPAANETLISNATQLLAFATKVNNGEFAPTDVAKLTADIDCSGIASWTPIGECSMTTWTASSLTTSGNLFAGTFDGQGHTISNLAMDFASSGSNKAYGFFGGIEDNATVKNITFDNTCSMNVSASYGSCFGVLAGIVKSATVQGINNYAAITGGGTSSLANSASGRTMVGAIIGEVHASSTPASLSNLHNYGNIGSNLSEFTRGTNNGTGADGVQVGGIVGFSTTTSTSTLVTFTNCINDGDIYTNAGRSSGIVAACNRYTKLKGCTNNGDITSSFSGNSRLGNITCIAAAGCELEDVLNTGDLIAVNSASVAGVICLINDNTVKLTRCSSIGATIVGKGIVLNGAQSYNGVLYGRCQKTAQFAECSVSGKVGKTISDLITLSAENYFQYVGEAYSTNTTINTTNITFASE